MDTTSHNFTWQTFIFDRLAGSSVLNDIAIIDENDIWVVGEIYMYDSLGNPDPQVYNAVHWNGSKWEMKRISVFYRGNLITPPLYGIYAFNSTDIWLSSGVPIHGDGVNWIQYHLFDMDILNKNDGYLTKIWGSSSSDTYYVGTLGTIAHYNGSNWTKIESGTELDIQDICGIKNTNTGKTEIYCTVVDFFSNDAKIIKVINNNKIEIIETNVGYIYSFWTQSGISFYLCGNKLYRNEMGNWKEVELDTSSPIIGISGNDYNDIYIIGANRFFSHFNGITWYAYPKSNLSTLSEYTVIATTTNKIVAGGTSNSKVEIMVGSK